MIIIKSNIIKCLLKKIFLMTKLSIILPDSLARASRQVSRKLGISRTQFIRQAIAHELANYQSRLEEEAIVRCVSAMKKSNAYLKEVEELD